MRKITFSNGGAITELCAANIWEIKPVKKSVRAKADCWFFDFIYGIENLKNSLIEGNEGDVRADHEKLMRFIGEVKHEVLKR
jgi:hypothetical protein